MDLSKHDLMQKLIQRFVSVTLKDGSVHAGFIGNPDDFSGDEMPPKMVLVNGILRDEVMVKDVVDVSFPKREDTTSIPVTDSIPKQFME